MKKIYFLAAGLLLSLVSCSHSDDNNNIILPPASSESYTFDGQQYNLLAAQSIIELKMPNVMEVNGQPYTRSSITITGMQNFINISTVSFDLFYKSSTTIAGTYDIYDTEDDVTSGFDAFLAPRVRGCLGWTSQATSSPGGSAGISANNPTGTVTVTVNSPTNYRIQYSGNYRIYDDGFNVIRNAPAVVNVSGEVTTSN